jgi:hypothetical protein
MLPGAGGVRFMQSTLDTSILDYVIFPNLVMISYEGGEGVTHFLLKKFAHSVLLVTSWVPLDWVEFF